MLDKTFTVDGKPYKITIYPGSDRTKRYPMILVLHGLAGLDATFLPEMKRFAEDLASQGYVTAVPGYFPDNAPPQSPQAFDPAQYRSTLLAAVDRVTKECPEADRSQLGFVGYSFGAATAMVYIATDFTGKVDAQVLVDFFGPTLFFPAISAGIGKFPPTLILHNENDKTVLKEHSDALDEWLRKGSIEHEIVRYNETWDKWDHHPFEPGKPADVDSRKQATEWIVKHLPPP